MRRAYHAPPAREDGGGQAGSWTGILGAEELNMAVDIRGKWALITGASRGIGRVVARRFGELGCNVVLHSRDRSHTTSLEHELTGLGVRVAAVAGELSDAHAASRLVDEALSAAGHLDILFNNAAVMTRYRDPYSSVTPEEFRLSFEVNVIAPITITYRLLPGMIERGWGRVVQVTSGIQDQPELMAYAASKAALDKFARDMAPKLRGTGVFMNLLDPGWLRTDLGGPNAPGAVESVLPGALVPVLIEDEAQGTLFRAQDHATHAGS
jgi:NAD(P)-dependent dehydrogenase (short-subunit alcohol dehydrogenase family)